jgi:peptidoglycan/xylan/chitin deacetylase (PgdA/CDA1 family)
MVRALAAVFCALLVVLEFPGGATARQAQRRVFVPVLIYHHVKWLKPSDDAIERGLTVLPTEFAAELRFLVTHGYHTITAAELTAYLRTGSRLPTHPVVLTFDDGYADVYSDTYPLLRKYHLTATLFIVPGFLGTPRYVSWRQVEEMARHGIDVEAHSMTHPDLTLIPRSRVWAEVDGSRNALQTRLHRPVRVFAYPYGDYDQTVLIAVRRAGFVTAFTTRQGWWQDSADLLTLPRVYVDLDDTVQTFAGRLRADPAILAEDPT